MSLVGSPSTKIKSASFPGVIEPSRSSVRVYFAPFQVAIRKTSAGADSGLDVKLELPVQREARQAIGTGHQRYARAVHHSHEFHHLCKRFAIAIDVGLGDIHRIGAQRPLEGGRHVRGDRGIAGAQFALAGNEHPLEHRERGVDHGRSSLQERDEGPHLRSVEVHAVRQLSPTMVNRASVRVSSVGLTKKLRNTWLMCWISS